MDGGPLHQRGPSAVIEGAHDRGTSFGVVRPPTEMNPVRPTVHRFRASHPKGRSEAEDPGGEAGGVDGRGRGGTLGMLRTGGRLTRRGLAGPSARGDGGGGPRAPREWITRARRRRASGVAAARARSALAVDRGRVVRLLHDEGRGPEGEDHRPRVESARVFSRPRRAAQRARRRPRRQPWSRRPRVAQARAFTRTSRAASCTAKAAAPSVESPPARCSGRGAERCVTACAPTSPRVHADEPCALVHGDCRRGEHRVSAAHDTGRASLRPASGGRAFAGLRGFRA